MNRPSGPVRVLATVALLVVATTAVPSLAQAPGAADPLGLAATGVLLPFNTTAGNKSILELASPVGDNATGIPVRLIFYTADCARAATATLQLTTNDIATVDLAQYVKFDGLLLIAGLVTIQLDNVISEITVPLQNPIHARVRWFNSANGSVRTLEPITVTNAEGAPSQSWNPLRSAATFVVPVQGKTSSDATLYLICPSSAITSEILFGPTLVPPATTGLRVRIYDANEVFLRDHGNVPCSCLSSLELTALDPIYANASLSSTYYTELEGISLTHFPDPEAPGPFTAYLGVKSRIQGPWLDEFHRLHSGNASSIQGSLNTQDR